MFCLQVIASCLDTLQPVILTDFTSKADLKRCLQCSANVPNIAGSPIQHRGMTLVDAAVFEAVPFRTAIADGCRCVLPATSPPPHPFPPASPPAVHAWPSLSASADEQPLMMVACLAISPQPGPPLPLYVPVLLLFQCG